MVSLVGPVLFHDSPSGAATKADQLMLSGSSPYTSNPVHKRPNIPAPISRSSWSLPPSSAKSLAQSVYLPLRCSARIIIIMLRYTTVLALAALCATSTLAYPHQTPRDVSASIPKRDLESLVNVLIARRDSLEEQMSLIQRRGMELEALVEELVARSLTAAELATMTQQRPQRPVTGWILEGGNHNRRTRPRRGNCSGQPLSTTGNGAQCAAYPRAHISGFLYVPQGQTEPRCDSREQMAQAPAATTVGSCFGTIVDGSVVTLAQSGH